MTATPPPRRALGLVLAVTSVVALGLGLTACAPPDKGASPSASAPVDGGTLRVAAPGSAKDKIDPNINSGSVIDLLRTEQIYDNLTKYDSDSKLTYQLAESMESNAAGDVWTIHLRPGVTFHDGSTFGAEDVIATIKRVIAPDSAANGKSLLGFITADGLTQIDDLTVEVHLDQPYGPFPEIWTNKYLRIGSSDIDAGGAPNGTGPFVYEAFTPGTSSTFTKNADYWGDKAHVDTLDILDFADNSAALNALKGGQVDITYSVPLTEAKAVDDLPGISILDSETGMYLPIVMRTDVAPYNDPRVREAFKLIVDRQEMVDVALNGYGAVANDYVGRYSSCGDPDLPQREQDIDKAKKLLAEAGQSNLQVEIAVTNGTAGMVEAAQVFAEQAKKAGVTVEVNNMDASVYLDNYLNWPLTVDFYTDTYLQLATRTLTPGASSNVTHWDNPEFLSLLNTAFETPDADARCAIENQMKAVEYNDSGNIVWGWANVVNAYADNVHGLTPDTTGKAVNRLNLVWLG